MIKPIMKVAVLSSMLMASMSYAADVTLKFGYPANEDNIWHKAALKFKSVAETNSDGRIEVKLYPNEQLGKEMDVINSIQLGTADMTITGESLQNWAPKAALMAVPYAFTSSEQLKKAVNGEVGKEISDQITKRTGLKPIAWFERGSRHLTSNRKILTPSDLDGLKLRVPNVPLFVKTWQALGAKPIPMAFSEVFTALQQSTIDGQENPLSLINSASFYEVQKYVNLTGHVRSWIYVVIGQSKLNSMPADLRAIVLDAGQQMQTFEHNMFASDEAKLRTILEDRGMEFVEPDLKAFKSAAQKAVQEALSSEQLELYKKI
ncbi:TRAP transporter substrate-binding protein [Marinomonas posidonica]|uniref:TRAP dicarboxylate transporter, DctP subunit n=1 Tax=Marinomonas posidonica (strain CECT 7376 / NCIMB 14433 / IVIA-Po-181) TaxID=491952 RepID=F6CYX2_MARPP|nr:TRAP transporter substrate-binding protein [Marinomonas posidonica]AEF53099.1 TRAP dicarboxylate transporter, DctP subunit [Marinomonas posidonica IVIA-Po-181]